MKVKMQFYFCFLFTNMVIEQWQYCGLGVFLLLLVQQGICSEVTMRKLCMKRRIQFSCAKTNRHTLWQINRESAADLYLWPLRQDSPPTVGRFHCLRLQLAIEVFVLLYSPWTHSLLTACSGWSNPRVHSGTSEQKMNYCCQLWSKMVQLLPDRLHQWLIGKAEASSLTATELLKEGQGRFDKTKTSLNLNLETMFNKGKKG